MQAQSVDAISGARWIAAGFGLFRLKPLVWVALAAAWLVIALALMAVPTLGQLVLYLLTPALGAGLLLGCQALERGDDLHIGHLFAGIRSHPAPLVTIGGVYLVGNVLVFGAFMLLGGGKIIAAALERAADPTGPPPDVPTDPLLAVLLLLPLFMAVIFAPALVVFRGVAPLEAMKMSFLACGRNLLTILIFAVLSALLALIAMLPYGLGTLIWIPVYAGAVYRGFQELFGSERPAQPTPP